MPFRRLRFAAVALLVFALLSVTPAVAQTDWIAECDSRAGDSFDAGRVGPGTKFEAIDPKAVGICERAVQMEPGTPRLLYQLGRALEAGGQFEQARAQYEAAGDYAPALAGLGYLYDEALGVPQDFAKALDYYRRAEAAGYVPAARYLGYMYEAGRGVEPDPAEALRLYREAAEAGDPAAYNNVGVFYERGLGGVAADPAAAAAWYRKGADTGDARAQVNLGFLHEQGRGVPQDDAAAARYYRMAAEQGDAIGRNNLGAMYSGGRGGVAVDHDEALRLYRLAADQGLPLAYRNIGLAYAAGHGVAADQKEAERWLRQAIEGGDVPALNSLAWLLAVEGTRLSEAQSLAEQAVAAAPDVAEFQDTLAYIYFLGGDAERALTHQERATALQPDYAPMQARLGDIYEKLGRKDEARAAWQRALALPDPAVAEVDLWDRAAVEAKLQQQP
jgi:TPR repeat protein